MRDISFDRMAGKRMLQSTWQLDLWFVIEFKMSGLYYQKKFTKSCLIGTRY